MSYKLWRAAGGGQLNQLSVRKYRSALPILVRAYHLLPSQSGQLLSDAGVGEVTTQVASSAKEAADLVRTRFCNSKATLRANALDEDPSRATIGRKSSGTYGFRGLAHEIVGEEQARSIAALMLADSSTTDGNATGESQNPFGFQSGAPPYNFKTFSQLLVDGGAKPTSESRNQIHLEFLMQADRTPRRQDNHSDQVHSGLTLSLRLLPDAPPTSGPTPPLTLLKDLAPDIVKVFPIDITPLVRVPVPPFSEKRQVSSAALSDALRVVGSAAAEEVIRTVGHFASSTDIGELGKSGTESLFNFVHRLLSLFWSTDAERFALTVSVPSSSSETSPQVRITSHRLEFDDYALGRQEYLRMLHERGEPSSGDSGMSAFEHTYTAAERRAVAAGLIYRSHPGGNIALFGYGAGMGMGTFDGVVDAGGSPINFFDGGGGANEQNAFQAMEVIAKEEGTDAVFVNIFGGITRSDLVAQGILRAIRTLPALESMPFIVRFRGNKAEEAQEVFRSAGLEESGQVIIENDFAAATKKVTEVAVQRKTGPVAPTAAGVPPISAPR